MSIAVRKQAEWMSKNDERILEYLYTSPRCRPREIRDGLEENGIVLRLEYVDGRLEKLERAGLLERDALRYWLSEQGSAYLVGEYDASAARMARF